MTLYSKGYTSFRAQRGISLAFSIARAFVGATSRRLLSACRGAALFTLSLDGLRPIPAQPPIPSFRAKRGISLHAFQSSAPRQRNLRVPHPFRVVCGKGGFLRSNAPHLTHFEFRISNFVRSLSDRAKRKDVILSGAKDLNHTVLSPNPYPAGWNIEFCPSTSAFSPATRHSPFATASS